MSWLAWSLLVGCPTFPEPHVPTGVTDTSDTGPGGVDSDGDGVDDADDCAPNDRNIFPGAEEIVGNLVDEDCDGLAPLGAHSVGSASAASVSGSFVPAVGDFDGDDALDLGLGVEGESNGWGVYDFDGGTFREMGSGTFSDPQDAFAWVVAAGVPDLDGDGADELAVTSANGVLNGRIRVVYDLVGKPSERLWVSNNHLGIGVDVAVVPDVDGDGAADLWVGVWGGRGAYGPAGAYLLTSATLGPSAKPLGLEADSFAQAWLPEAGGSFGGLVGGGDLDGDGLAELLLGTGGDTGPPDGKPHADPMTVAVYDSSLSGRSDGALNSQQALLGLITGEGQDRSVWDWKNWPYAAISADAAVGDVNGDGCNDVVTGMAFDESHRGTLQVVHGCPDAWVFDMGPDAVDARVVGPSAEVGFGMSVAVLPDYFEGEAVVAVGDPFDAAERGRVYLLPASKLQGSVDLVTEPDAAVLELVGGNMQELGTTLVHAGDMDGDGRSDLLVGEGVHDYGDQVFLVLGGAVPSTVQ